MATIKVRLNSNRNYGGILSLHNASGAQVGNGLSVLGKAAVDTATQHNNPLCDSKWRFGDTPAGIYNFIAITNPGAGPYNDAHKYGPNGVIQLDPFLGDAATAKKNGRTGILIHGGDPGPNASLRRTNGCLRMANNEYAHLREQIYLLLPVDPITTIEVSQAGSSSPLPCDHNSSCDEGDPPPGY